MQQLQAARFVCAVLSRFLVLIQFVLENTIKNISKLSC